MTGAPPPLEPSDAFWKRVDVFLREADHLAYTDPEGALRQLELADQLLARLQTDAPEAHRTRTARRSRCERQRAGALRTLGRLPECLEAADRALTLAREAEDRAAEAHTQVVIAAARSILNENPAALEAAQQAVALARELGEPTIEFRALNNMGIVLRDLEEREEALAAYGRALEILDGHPDEPRFRPFILNNRGLVYRDMGDFDRAEEEYHAALKALERQNLSAWGTTLCHLGEVAMHRKDYAAAFRLYETALERSRETANREYEITSLYNLGRLYAEPAFAGNDPAQAETHFRQAADLAREAGHHRLQPPVLEHLSELLAANERWAEAYQQRKDHHAAWKQANSLEQRKRGADLQARFRLRQSQAEAEAAKARSRELAELYDKVEQQRQLLETSNAALRRLNREKDELLGIAAHDLKTPLSAIAGYAQMIAEEVTGDQAEDIREMAGIIETTIQSLSLLVTNLLDINAVGRSSLRPHSRPFPLRDTIEARIEQYRVLLKQKDQTVSLHVPDGPAELCQDQQAVDHVLNNLLSNAIKFSPIGSQITVTAEPKAPDAWAIHIDDEGPGIAEDERPRLFQPFTRLGARPTGGETSSGLGLAIADRVTRLLGGSLTHRNRSSGGSRFTILLPRAPRATPTGEAPPGREPA